MQTILVQGADGWKSYGLVTPIDFCKVLSGFFPGQGYDFDEDDLVVPTGPPASDKPDGPTAEFAPQGFASMAFAGAERESPVASALRNLVINRVRRQTGKSLSEVSQVVSEVESTGGRPLLDWLTNGGLLELIKLIVALLG